MGISIKPGKPKLKHVSAKDIYLFGSPPPLSQLEISKIDDMTVVRVITHIEITRDTVCIGSYTPKGKPCMGFWTRRDGDIVYRRTIFFDDDSEMFPQAGLILTNRFDV